tara:strand:+ start:10929 stop:11108 length:180 start_codon:yes stop_codon:yes gene_type:complete
MITIELDDMQIEIVVRDELTELLASLIDCMEDPDMVGHVAEVLKYYSVPAREDGDDTAQ